MAEPPAAAPLLLEPALFALLGSSRCASHLASFSAELPCLQLLASKLLGCTLLGLALTATLPQIVRIVRSGTSRGVSPSSYAIDTAASLVCMSYAVRNAWALSTYGETYVYLAQNMLVLTLMFVFPRVRMLQLAMFGAGATAFTYALLTPAIVPGHLLMVLNSLTIPFFIFSKIPQIMSNYSSASTGSLSAYTVANSLFGTTVRAFTVALEVGDEVVVAGYIASSILNAIIMAQIVCYSGKASAADKTTKTE